ncbi:uncharacterized protein C9orf40 homolog [Leptodactylus fuscus]|uniref:uncharacterized protein C9orf40 homolog n=1 Tax=Leptodactylus fuscus TaxID=238119 RepID=UPI003F4E5036
MAKRKCEQPLIALLPPCKRPLSELAVCPRRCMPHTVQVSPKKKRKLEPEVIPAAECERLQAPSECATTEVHPPSKKLRLAESQGTKASPDFQCQKDEAFREYNSFHFWRTPLPDIDFSELADGSCDSDRQVTSSGTEVLEEMDN